METLRQYVARLKATTKQIQVEGIEKIILAHEAEIMDANTSQLMDGIDSKGKKLQKYRSKSYARFKLSLNPKGVTDLKLEGDFHSGFHLVNESFPFEIDSYDYKTPKLIELYDPRDIFGVTKKNISILSKDYFLEAIQDFYRSLLSIR